jgi:hypothetical protein
VAGEKRARPIADSLAGGPALGRFTLASDHPRPREADDYAFAAKLTANTAGAPALRLGLPKAKSQRTDLNQPLV